MIKRMALLLTVVGTLALAGVALAATGFFGKFDNGGKLTFDLETPGKGNGQYTVEHWTWDNLKIKCRNGRHRYDGRFTNPITVNPETRMFSEWAVNQWGGKAILHGQFDETYKTANGTFKIKGRTAVGRRCRSGEVKWRAAEVVRLQRSRNRAP